MRFLMKDSSLAVQRVRGYCFSNFEVRATATANLMNILSLLLKPDDFRAFRFKASKPSVYCISSMVCRRIEAQSCLHFCKIFASLLLIGRFL